MRSLTRVFLRSCAQSKLCSYSAATAGGGNSLAKGLPAAWKKTYDATNQNELLQAYDAWATTYDNDSMNVFGYKAPDAAVELLVKFISKDSNARILDLGAGTGLVGERLFNRGFRNLVAVDLSTTMLDVAQSKNCYKELLVLDANSLLFTDNYFDAAISVGTFTPNHAGVPALNEVVRAVRPGGILCLSLRDDFLSDETNGFAGRIAELTAAIDEAADNDALRSPVTIPDVVGSGIAFSTAHKKKRLQLIHVSESQVYTTNVSKDIMFRCWLWKVM